MSDDDQEIIPPERKGLPATREGNRNLPAQPETNIPQPTGVVGSWLTGFQAEHEARAYRKIAEKIRAQTDVIDAQTDLRSSAMKLLSKTGELEDFDKTLAVQKTERQQDRLTRYAKLDETRDELKHRQRTRAEEREEEFAAAERKKLQAQNYRDYVKETKDINVRIGVARKEGLLTEQQADKADAENALNEIQGRGEKQARSGVEEARAELAAQYDAALNSGDHVGAARIKEALDALDALKR